MALELKQRLSRSVIWKLQRNYFERRGIEAWSTGAVPHHITSSPFIANAYANVVFGFLRDCLAAEGEREVGYAPLDPSQPVYIVELGSGSGRFGHLFLKKLLAQQRDSGLKKIPIKYVMTDFTERTLAHWRSQLSFQSLIDEGLLDFARFDVEQDQTLTLVHSGETISARSLRNPLVVIANYLFDSIPQDAFFAAGGQLFEILISLMCEGKEMDVNDPEILSSIEVSYDQEPINGSYYADANWNLILSDYKKRITDAPFLFPTAALQCIRNLHRLSCERMLLLSGDRGYSNDEALLEGKGAPTMAMHGSFSMMVDYQIIGEYCRHLGGQVLHPGRHAESLNISAFMFGGPPGGFVQTRQNYAEAIEKFSPDDFFTLKEGIARIYDILTLDQILAFLRLSCWDYKRFWECLPVLKQHLADISDLQKQRLHDAILRVWDSYLPIGEENDLAFELGTFLLEMEFHTEALEFLQRSVELNGIAPGTAYNIAVCHYSLGQMDQALDYANQALSLDQEFVEARTLRRELEAALASTTRKQRRKRA
jgi:tetratricopeptide (TPR) repeat protein